MPNKEAAQRRDIDEPVSIDNLHRFDEAHRFSGIVNMVPKLPARRRLLVSIEAVVLGIGAVAAFCAGGVFGGVLGFVLAVMCANEMTRR